MFLYTFKILNFKKFKIKNSFILCYFFLWVYSAPQLSEKREREGKNLLVIVLNIFYIFSSSDFVFLVFVFSHTYFLQSFYVIEEKRMQKRKISNFSRLSTHTHRH